MMKHLFIDFQGKVQKRSISSLVANTQHPVSVKPMPNPTPEMLNNDPIFEAIWQVIKDWDINVPEYYWGYSSGTGSHATLIYDLLPRKPPRLSW